jgi:NAD(P)-dependent dehydrogenase (short-subunit alcohol dehydrogenase family)
MNIIVTGASRGIGYQTALRFATDPDHAVLALSRDRKALKILERECLEKNPQAGIRIYPFDLENPGKIPVELPELAAQGFDSLDILVNNAGLLIKKPITELSPEEVNRMMTVNYTAPMVLVRSLMPLLAKAPAAHVVNIGSMAGVQGSRKFPGLCGYGAAKAALHILTECLAVEYADTTVRFNALALGSVQTEMLGVAFPGLKAPLKDFEMAEYICDFALSGHRYFNGKTLPVALSTP